MNHRSCLSLIFLLCFLLCPGLYAKGGSHTWSSTISLGYTTQDFKGDETANFQNIQHYLFDLKLQWHKSWYTFGIGFGSIPSVSISQFRLSTGELGHYKLSFDQTFFLMGAIYKKVAFNIIFGNESARWAGTPNMGLNRQSHTMAGFEFSYDAYTHKDMVFPIWLRVWSKPQRDLEFINYPNDTIIVKSGIETDLCAAIRFDF